MSAAGHDHDGLAAFERARPALLAMAYRMLGTRHDAEDVVQDVFLRWAQAHRSGIRDPAAWMMTVCTRRSVDLLRAVSRSRTDYVGSWLPEPIAGEWIDAAPELSSTLETAFLLVLERASPRERAAFLLHEVFGLAHTETAAVLGVTVAASRQLASRARRHVMQGRPRHAPPPERQRALLTAFRDAILTDDMTAFSAVLAEDARLVADGGGKATAFGKPVQGRAAVLGQLEQARLWWRGYRWIAERLASGFGLLDGDVVVARIWLEESDDTQISSIYVMRNPDKLRAAGP